MDELIQYLDQTEIDIGDWLDKSNSKFDAFSQDGISHDTIDIQDSSTTYLDGDGISIESRCPNDKSISTEYFSLDFSYQPFCTGATLLRPVLIAFTWVFCMVLYFRSL